VLREKRTEQINFEGSKTSKGEALQYISCKFFNGPDTEEPDESTNAASPAAFTLGLLGIGVLALISADFVPIWQPVPGILAVNRCQNGSGFGSDKSEG
jgi:hypothetical protein